MFDEFLENEEAKRRVVRWLHAGTLPHAILLTAENGCGRNLFARLIAQAYLNDDNNLVMRGIHPDCLVVEGEGASGNIPVKRIRALSYALNLSAVATDGVRVAILKDVKNLNKNAANALLKILEEPPAAVTLVLLTSQPFALLDTIRSRCQDVRFYPLTGERLTEWLQARLACPENTARTLAMLAAGRPAEALRLSDEDPQELRKQMLDIAQNTGSVKWPEQARRLWEHSAELPEALALLLTWYRDLLLRVSGAPDALLINVDRKQEMERALAGETVNSLLKKCEAILTSADQLSRNVNVQLVLEVLFMKLESVPPSHPADEAKEKLCPM